MIQKIITRNRKKIIAYNELRKQMFAEFSPEDSEIILYLLPWLLSVNEPECPGYLADIDTIFRVFDIAGNKVIKKKESEFKDLFDIDVKSSLVKLRPTFCTILGLYIIGSVGTLSQTATSDCDIWICYDKKDYSETQLKQLKKKIYLIGEWIDANCKIPVHFFILDVEDIQNCRFGSVDEESSGSAQANVLKEEFYRTCMVIAGKIPLWWACYDNRTQIDYKDALAVIGDDAFWEDDLVDFGDLENVDAEECFGAALWQIQKSLESPLKSFIKMLLLKMQLDASDDELLCHRFRQHVTVKRMDAIIPDPSVFSMLFLMDYLIGTGDGELTEFVKKCYYLRCEIKPYSKKYIIKKKLANKFFNKYQIEKEVREELSRFSRWSLAKQISFGKQIYNLLLKSYRQIVTSQKGVVSRIGKKDLTVVGRKIQVYYEAKPSKVVILPKSTPKLNISNLTFKMVKNRWYVYSANDESGRIVDDTDIVFVIAFVVRNQLFEAGRTHMLPNSSNISVSEIVNLGARIDAFFVQGGHRFQQDDFLKKAYIIKILVVISFEEQPWEKTGNKIRIVYMNSWGEMFAEKITSITKLKTVLKTNRYSKEKASIDFYLQKKCLNHTEILNAVKKIPLF